MAVVPPATSAMILMALLSGCGGSTSHLGPPVPLAQAALVRPATAGARFFAGGAGNRALLLCGDRAHLLTLGNEEVEDVEEKALDVVAVCLATDPSADLALVRTASGIALTHGGMATPLLDWPAGVVPAAAVFSTNGALLAAAPGEGDDRALRIWVLRGGASGGGAASGGVAIADARRLDVHIGATVRHLAADAAGKYLFTADDQGHLAIYQVPQRKPVYTQLLDPDADGEITSIDLSSDGDWFVVAARAIRVRAWRLPFMSAPLAAWGQVRSVFFTDGLTALITVDETGAAIRWLLNYGKVKADATAQLGDPIAVGHDGGAKNLFAVTRDDSLHAWHAGDLTPLLGAVAAGCGGK